MYGCESWTIKKAEGQRIDAFELWCWRRLLRVPWTARLSNQSILKEISPEYSLEGLMLKLKLQYLGHLMRTTDSLEKILCWERLKAGKGDDRGWDGWMASLTWWTLVWANAKRWWWPGKPGMLQSMGSQRVRHKWVTELITESLFQWSCMDVRVGLWRKLSTKELMLLNCGVGEDSWESLGLQGDPTSPFWRRSTLGFLWKEWC